MNNGGGFQRNEVDDNDDDLDFGVGGLDDEDETHSTPPFPTNDEDFRRFSGEFERLLPPPTTASNSGGGGRPNGSIPHHTVKRSAPPPTHKGPDVWMRQEQVRLDGPAPKCLQSAANASAAQAAAQTAAAQVAAGLSTDEEAEWVVRQKRRTIAASAIASSMQQQQKSTAAPVAQPPPSAVVDAAVVVRQPNATQHLNGHAFSFKMDAQRTSKGAPPPHHLANGKGPPTDIAGGRPTVTPSHSRHHLREMEREQQRFLRPRSSVDLDMDHLIDHGGDGTTERLLSNGRIHSHPHHQHSMSSTSYLRSSRQNVITTDDEDEDNVEMEARLKRLRDIRNSSSSVHHHQSTASLAALAAAERSSGLMNGYRDLGGGMDSKRNRKFRANCRDPEGRPGFSVEFGKFVAMISVSGFPIRRQHLLCLSLFIFLVLVIVFLIPWYPPDESVDHQTEGSGSQTGTESPPPDPKSEEKEPPEKEAEPPDSEDSDDSAQIEKDEKSSDKNEKLEKPDEGDDGVNLDDLHEIPRSPEARMAIVEQLLTQVPLIDGHNDLPYNIRKFIHNRLNEVNFTYDLRNISPWSRSPWSHTDLNRLRQGMVGGQFWVAYAPCDSQHFDAVQITLEQIDLIKRFIQQYPGHLVYVNDSTSLLEAHGSGRVASLISVESGHSIGTSMSVLRMFHKLGAVSMTLTHNCNTPWADCSEVDKPGMKPEHNGLTPFGKTVIKEMNRLGMIIDLSHSSLQTAKDAIEVSEAPVIFSHSSAYAKCNSTRNVNDELLKLLARKRGMVMVNFFSFYLTCSNSSTIHDVVAHLTHIKEECGIECVGIGASYDGIKSPPKGLEDVSKYPQLFATLLGSGMWTIEDLKKLAGLNFLRVFREVEKVSLRLRSSHIQPNEDHINPDDIKDNLGCRSLAKRDANHTC